MYVMVKIRYTTHRAMGRSADLQVLLHVGCVCCKEGLTCETICMQICFQ